MTTKRTVNRVEVRSASIALSVVFIAAGLMISGCASTGADAPVPVGAAPAPDLADKWGIEVVALRLTGADYMLDFRYRVLDPAKAAELFEHANKPVLIHQASGARLEVPRPAKTGPLRPTNPPQADRIYFILFSNPGVVHAGDEVMVKIGDFEADVVVE